MDFIIQLSKLMNYKNIMMIINYLKKDSIIMPVKQINAETIVKIFLNYFIWNHRLPDAIILDRGRIFIESLWKCLCQLLKIIHRLSTIFHPKTDGSMEQANAEIEAYL